MGELAKERLIRMKEASHLYFDWLSVLRDAGVRDIQDLQGQYLLKCPFHEDKRPSFRIRLNEHNFHCFSCNAYGTVADLMWRLSGQSMSEVQFMEALLKRNPAMQAYLGFNSLFLDHRSLDEGFNRRRVFDPKNHIGSSMPLSVLSRKVRSHGDTWENLVFSMTLLQEGESPETIISRLKKVASTNNRDTSDNVISLASLILEE